MISSQGTATRRAFSTVLRDGNIHCYDVCVIGAGPAGVTAALRAADYGQRVCLIDEKRVGGADLWDGALQSKTLWEMAKFQARTRAFGQKVFTDEYLNSLELNESAMRDALREVSSEREQQILRQLEASDVTLIQGCAEFQSAKQVDLHYLHTRIASVRANYFVIATGSVPRPHPDFHADGEVIVTSDHIMQQFIPESIVIVGAGVVGCEFASILANLGKTRVSIIEKASRMLPMEDEDVAGFIEERLTSKGVVFHHQSSLVDLRVCETDELSLPRAVYTIQHNTTGEQTTYEVEKALMSIGRIPNYARLCLERAGCSIQKGRLLVDEFQRCIPHKHIYACGDASVGVALVNVGESEAVTAIDHMFLQEEPRLVSGKYRSTIMFLDLEVAAVGLSEQECQRRNIAYIASRFNNDYITRAIVMGSSEGFVKILVTDNNEKLVLGVRAVGEQASSIIELASLAISKDYSLYELYEMLPAYPAMAQGFQEGLRLLIGRSVFKPNKLSGAKLWRWSPQWGSGGRAYPKGNPMDKKKA